MPSALLRTTPRRQTLDGEVYADIRRKIVSLQLEPGEIISENATAAEYGVSRMPIRQAFLRLQGEELLQIVPQRGAFVSKLSERKFREAQFVRQSLEAAAFGRLTALWNERDPRFRKAETRIRKLIRDQESAVAKMDYVRFIALDEEYHTAFLELLGNQTLIGVVTEMMVHLNRVRFLELKEAQHESEAIRFHREILDAVLAKDVDRTVRCLQDHLQALQGFWEGLFTRHARYFE